jgi:DNA-binding NarL/FixJ family response regulator
MRSDQESTISSSSSSQSPAVVEVTATERPPATVLLIDDHAILREGLSALLELESDLRVVGHAATIPEGLALAVELRPDLIITDVSLPGATGVQGIVELRQAAPHARLVVLTVHATEEYIRAALGAGADGYVLKDAGRNELIYGLRSVLNGQRHLCARTSARIVHSYLGDRPKVAATMTGVTGREREVLSMIASGLSNKRIATSLNRSVKTVEKHRANLMRKLQLHNVADVTRFALQSGLLREDPREQASARLSAPSRP